ncbi:hypothetical protein D3C87_2070610 [compost metagenome]
MKAAITLTVDSSPSDKSATDPVTHQATSFRPMTPNESGMPQKANRWTMPLPSAMSCPLASASELQKLVA